MSRSLRWALVVASMGLPAAAGADTARQAVLAVGQIDGIERAAPGEVSIVRRDGRREDAERFRYLFDGDQVLLRGSSAMVTLLLKGTPEPVVIEAARQRAYTVSTSRQMSVGERLSAMLARFDYLFGGSAATQSVSTQARGGNEGAPPPDTVRLTSAISGPQSLPPGNLIVSPVWSGAAVSVRLEDARGAVRRSVIAMGKTTVAVPIDEDMTAGTLVVEGRDHGATLRWSFRRVADPPRDPELSAAPPSVGALWFATEGPTEWRLYGLSQLRALSDTDFAARDLWAAARLGRLQPQAAP